MTKTCATSSISSRTIRAFASERREYTPAVRVHHHAKHYIVYLIEDDHILIVRVLRDEMDLTNHLRTEK